MILGAIATAAFAANQFVPAGIAIPGLWEAGALVMVVALGLDLWAMLTMHRYRANILPHRAATALVVTGPFALSRNPIYLGNTLLLAGAGLAFSNAWLLLGALAQAWFVRRLAIQREEAHLAIRFGGAWRDYAARTPRWMWLV